MGNAAKTPHTNDNAKLTSLTLARNTERGYRSVSLKKVIGCSTIFHESTKDNRNTLIIPPFPMGITIRNSVC